jgi:type IV pilus assembly protein PilE
MNVSRGFTLVELVIVMLLVALFAAGALPSYQSLLTRARRADAAAALMAVGAAQERHRMIWRSYATATAPAPPDGLGFGNSERGFYAVEILRANAGSFLAVARPAPDSPQWGDERCLSFSLDETGGRGAAPGTVEECWR